MRQRDYSLSLPEGEGRGEGDMEIPPHPAPGRLGIRLANPPHPSPPDGGEGTHRISLPLPGLKVAGERREAARRRNGQLSPA